jgi:hypothetical protein
VLGRHEVPARQALPARAATIQQLDLVHEAREAHRAILRYRTRSHRATFSRTNCAISLGRVMLKLSRELARWGYRVQDAEQQMAAAATLRSVELCANCAYNVLI